VGESIALIPLSNCLPSPVLVRSPYDILNGTEPHRNFRPASGEKRLSIMLSAPPEPFGIYVEAVKEGSLLFLNGMFRTQGREAKFIGRVGAELLQKVFGKDRNLAVFVYGVASLTLWRSNRT
jgi:hypothetical protein